MILALRARVWLLLLLFLHPVAVGAQVGPGAQAGEEDTEEEEQPEEEDRESPFVAAAWCTFQSKAQDSDEERPGCDIGIGVSLYEFGRNGRWRIGAAVGSWSFGPTLAYVALQPERGPVVAVGIGLLMRYDSGGIDRGGELAVGATFGF